MRLVSYLKALTLTMHPDQLYACKRYQGRNMGWQEEEGDSSSVQIENVKYTLLMKELEHCKST